MVDSPTRIPRGLRPYLEVRSLAYVTYVSVCHSRRDIAILCRECLEHDIPGYLAILYTIVVVSDTSHHLPAAACLQRDFLL